VPQVSERLKNGGKSKRGTAAASAEVCFDYHNLLTLSFLVTPFGVIQSFSNYFFFSHGNTCWLHTAAYLEIYFTH